MTTSDEQVVEHLELLTTGGSNITYIREGLALIKRLQAENERLRKANLDLDTDLAWEQTK